MRKKNIPYAMHWIDEEDIAAVAETLRSAHLTTGPKIAEFEDAIREVAGADHVTAVCNGTAALHAACFAAGIGPGDEVITSAMTFAATANSVLYMGGAPVFCDIDPATWNIDADKIESLITSRTKAIIPVHYTGQPCDMDRISAIAKRRNLIVIEDAAHALGASYRGKPIGSISDMTVFSFHPAKHITTGEGGAIATSNEFYHRMLATFRVHGITRDPEMYEFNRDIYEIHDTFDIHHDLRDVSDIRDIRRDIHDEHDIRHDMRDIHDTRSAKESERYCPASWYYEQQHLGYNYRLNDIQAALGLSQLKRLPAFLQRRKEIAHMYNEAFECLCQDGLMVLPNQLDGADSAWHIYVVSVPVPRIVSNDTDRGGALRNGKQSSGSAAVSERDWLQSVADRASAKKTMRGSAIVTAQHRDKVFNYLKTMGLGVNLHYIPVYLHPYYQKLGYHAGACPEAEALYSSILTLPLYPAMTNEDVEYVIKCVRRALLDSHNSQ
ncbi:MAG: aminotransferase class I/II-fold pyridoxal phosphate-dependent enzyme [Oscillospiraceae bacterium]|nr:aminotransferase class I/II-fold pyridoxal phosphate-dependent enzyme [Oscillospiraceae bacterium]